MTAAKFVAEAEALLQKIEVYERSGEGEISTRDLVIVKRAVGQMLHAAREGAVEPREHRLMTLTRMVLDQWPLGHALSNAVSEVERAYARLP